MRPATEHKDPRPRLLLIGIDGLRLGVAQEPGVAPTLQRLQREGGLHRMEMEVPTISGPGWASILTGTTHAQHGITDNSFVGHRLHAHPDFLALAFHRDITTRTFAAAGWPPLVSPEDLGPVVHQRREQQFAGLHRVVSRDGETHGYTRADAEVATATVTWLDQSEVHVAFCYFCDTDDTAHAHGVLGQEYRDAITRVDAHVERIMRAIATRSGRGEKWMVVVTTDHGHLDEGGHGGASPEERASFALVWSSDSALPAWPDMIEPHTLVHRMLRHRYE